MDPPAAAKGEAPPDLRDLETKVGRKTPEGLLRWMREDPVLRVGESAGQLLMGNQGLGDKIEALKLELACLRAIDVQILQQLLAVNEGIEAVKWILEEKGTLTSRCSSLTSSQYSLAESQETSRRGSWNSLQDPTDKLDSISIGSYLDTLADDMDEYSLSTSEPVGSSTPHRHGLPLSIADPDGDKDAFSRMEQVDYMAMTPMGLNNADKSKLSRQHGLAQGPIPNGSLKHGPEACVEVRPSETKPKMKSCQNGRVDLDKVKLPSKVHLEYDAHWRWVQSQDDVTFL
ncbi:leucine rich adaptor protein 1 [Pseudophryne corroboree]|uniref:leucine rich adaptor protein 1 n=1 Tax=Pseudophryne corroboree TaxID=495146 RepID=UPI0030818CBF